VTVNPDEVVALGAAIQVCPFLVLQFILFAVVLIRTCTNCWDC
jgi:hypothetical protein